MKKQLLLALGLLPLAASGQFDTQPALRLSPAQPAPGQPLTLTYTPARPMAGTELVGYALRPDAPPLAMSLPLQADGKGYKATFTVPAGAKAMAFTFKDKDDAYDQNDDRGYGTLLYQNGKPLPGSRSEAAIWLRQWASLADLEFTDRAALRSYFEQDFKENPEAKKNYMPRYLQTFSQRDEQEKARFKQGVEELASLPDLTEDNLGFLATAYGNVLNDREKAEKYRQLIQEKYPNGGNAFRMSLEKEFTAFNAEKDLEKKKALYTDLMQRHSSNREAEGFMTNLTRRLIAAYMAAGKLSEAAAVVTAPKVQSELMSTYNNAAWQWAEKGEKLAEAEQMAKQATEWARAETSRPPTEADASYLTAAQRTQQARSRYSMYADTYAYILDKAGKTRQAVPLMQEVAEGIGQYKNAEYNQRYAEILANAKEGKALQSFAEKAISAGKSTAAIDSLLRVQYVAGKGSDKGYDTYIAGFKKSGEAAARAALQRKMLDKPAPAFSLTDLQGNTVSLEGLRGKVVVVDFWATWCGPCIKSFPAMQKAVNKYKNDPGVKFLFVNTWQQEPDKKKNAADFIAKRGYDFQVLLDEKDEVVSRFGVSGIPTKFVIGPDGRIRFKAVGFEGSDDAVVQELSSMIEVAAGKAPAATAQGSSGR